MSLAALESSIEALVSSLEAHEKFREQQTQRRGKIFFMWDFVKTTLGMLDMSQNNAERKSEVMQRCMFTDILLNDITGKFTRLCGGDTTGFGDDIKQKGADCKRKAEEWGSDFY
ncbi:hypothetical protein EV426DRAFT_581684 [Tirmania nivea]|nr:hypothetical protein EV426DRAFT_581684 [Tirmania nivea]